MLLEANPSLAQVKDYRRTRHVTLIPPYCSRPIRHGDEQVSHVVNISRLYIAFVKSVCLRQIYWDGWIRLDKREVHTSVPVFLKHPSMNQQQKEQRSLWHVLHSNGLIHLQLPPNPCALSPHPQADLHPNTVSPSSACSAGGCKSGKGLEDKKDGVIDELIDGGPKYPLLSLAEFNFADT